MDQIELNSINQIPQHGNNLNMEPHWLLGLPRWPNDWENEQIVKLTEEGVNDRKLAQIIMMIIVVVVVLV